MISASEALKKSNETQMYNFAQVTSILADIEDRILKACSYGATQIVYMVISCNTIDINEVIRRLVSSGYCINSQRDQPRRLNIKWD